MINPRYIVKYVFNREAKESETRIFDSSIKTQPDKFGNIETDVSKPVGNKFDNFKKAQLECHILNLEHQEGYRGSDLCKMMEKTTFYASTDHFLPNPLVNAIEYYGYEVRQVGLGEWRIIK